jgi:hypothetical protein
MPTKINNGKDTMPNVVDMAAKVSEESRAVVDSMTHMSATATEEAKTLLAAQQEALQKGFEMWQEYSQTYSKFVLDATEQSLRQSLAFRENMDKIISDSFKKAHTLSLEERQFGVEAAELFQAQAQAASEYAAEMFTTASKVMTTTALFSDWAAERVAKMFTSISTN